MCDDGAGPTVVSVNVGLPRTVEVDGTVVTTAIWKAPVAGRVAVGRCNLAGDRQADPTVHGGVDKAVYAYAAEDLAWWADELGRDVPPGAFGENLTTAGIDLRSVAVGEVWAIGSAVLAVTQPRVPCYKLAVRFGDRSLPRRFAAAGRPGAYVRVLQEGELAAGDRLHVLSSPDQAVTVGLVATAYHSHDAQLTGAVLRAPGLPASWYDWARARVG
ncbi:MULTISPECIES: MOSC domain-containing protein [unclassified Frankia]|uniref:MOSC domain-containing protein n=1 Tax=unclassified Frankia TaxID=2632575 RepID=UPI002AD52FC9|nr:MULTISPECIES: MOSC domain-containing protein [unclassified Frankia]